jgi:hypothetical protein
VSRSAGVGDAVGVTVGVRVGVTVGVGLANIEAKVLQESEGSARQIRTKRADENFGCLRGR